VFIYWANQLISKRGPPSSPAASMLDGKPTVDPSAKVLLNKAVETAVFTSMNDPNSSIIPNNFSLELRLIGHLIMVEFDRCTSSLAVHLISWVVRNFSNLSGIHSKLCLKNGGKFGGHRIWS